MKLKKIIAYAAAAAVAVSAMAVSVFAANVDVTLVTQDSESWTNVTCDAVNISADGEYSFSLSDLGMDPEKINVIYLKDATCVDSQDPAYSSDFPKDAVVECTSLKINGKDVSVNSDMYKTMTDGNKVVFDFCFYNIWDVNYIELPAQTVDTIDVTIKVSGLSGDAAPAPAADSSTASSGTGNTAASVMVTVMAVAGAAAIASRKRK